MEHDTKCQNATDFSALCLLCITDYERWAQAREQDEEPEE